jgi:hypothetical protein
VRLVQLNNNSSSEELQHAAADLELYSHQLSEASNNAARRRRRAMQRARLAALRSSKWILGRAFGSGRSTSSIPTAGELAIFVRNLAAVTWAELRSFVSESLDSLSSLSSLDMWVNW